MDMTDMKRAATFDQTTEVDGVPIEMHTVLEAWGRWNRERRQIAAGSISSQLKIFRDNRCPACYEGEACPACQAEAAKGSVSAAPLVSPVEVEKAMLQLPDRSRELLRAHYYRGVNPHITARVLGFPYRAYRLHLRSASFMVRNFLQKQCNKPFGTTSRELKAFPETSASKRDETRRENIGATHK